MRKSCRFPDVCGNKRGICRECSDPAVIAAATERLRLGHIEQAKHQSATSAATMRRLRADPAFCAARREAIRLKNMDMEFVERK